MILLAPTADLARHILSTQDVLISCEAEYGSYVAEGRLYTAAHHQPAGTKYAGTHVGGSRPAPCNDVNIPVVAGDGLILISHVDLDTLGGCLRARGNRALFAEAFQPFWDLAEYVDTHGFHKLAESGADAPTTRALYAYTAWASTHGLGRLSGTVTDVTAYIAEAAEVLQRILDRSDPDLYEAGVAFEAAGAALNRATFSRWEGHIILRVTTQERQFCNHMYSDPAGVAGVAVACFNPFSGTVTISLAEPVEGVSCRAILQELWGREAGGHDGSAGSPRGMKMTDQDFQDAVAGLASKLSQA